MLSAASFNALETALVAPVMQSGGFPRYAGFAVPLAGLGTRTQGVALVNMVRTLDLEARGASRMERAPIEVTDDALARPHAILD